MTFFQKYIDNWIYSVIPTVLASFGGTFAFSAAAEEKHPFYIAFGVACCALTVHQIVAVIAKNCA